MSVLIGGVTEFSVSQTEKGEPLVTLSLQSERGYNPKQSVKIALLVDFDDNPSIAELQLRTLEGARDWLNQHAEVIRSNLQNVRPRTAS